MRIANSVMSASSLMASVALCTMLFLPFWGLVCAAILTCIPIGIIYDAIFYRTFAFRRIMILELICSIFGPYLFYPFLLAINSLPFFARGFEAYSKSKKHTPPEHIPILWELFLPQSRENQWFIELLWPAILGSISMNLQLVCKRIKVSHLYDQMGEIDLS